VQRVAANPETLGLALGLAGVIAFSLTLPMTRLAVGHLEPAFVALGRALLAALCGALYLWFSKAKIPARAEFGRLILTSLGVVLGFPFLTTWAMRDLPAAHGAVVVGLLPLATAVAGAVLAKERPSSLFWLFAGLGSALVVGFVWLQGGGHIALADLLLVGAVVAAAIGYAEGAKLSRLLGGLGVISWALVVAAPVLPIPFGLEVARHPPAAPPGAWLGFLYVSLISQFLGFMVWYRGLALGGIARVGQIQLLQPFLTLIFAALVLGERLDALTVGFAVLIVGVVLLGRRAPVKAG
jgi:drug/metabolite transporter (DMT)-like permease